MQAQTKPPDQEIAMTCHDTPPTQVQNPSPSRMRHVETRLRTDAEAVLREIAYVLTLTQRVKRDILNAHSEAETAGA
jgi:hypothetical protein